MAKAEIEFKPDKGIPFWMIAVIIALLGIFSYKLTHDAAISELLFLLLLGLAIVKLVPRALRLFAILTITLIFILVMLAWVGTLLN